jgi:A/G-specific adenine glycosylase
MARIRKARLESLRRRLLAWYRRHKRALPWRSSRNPYAIWVSEIMLQQTRVAAVEPYFRRWMTALPALDDLAGARSDTVLKLWEGLGYYSRARNLHAAAKLVRDEYGGCVPRDPAELQTLPGIGRYTAAAIASIAFGRDVAVVDGNVARVLTRLFDIDQPTGRAETKRLLDELADELLPPGRARSWNQAMMELGALLCLPKRAACDRCPVRPNCLARRAGRQHERPVGRAKKTIPHHVVVAGVIRKGSGAAERILIDRRPADAMLGGLWEFPGGKVEPGESLGRALRREVREEVGLEVTVGKEIATVPHAYSHFRITMHVFACRVRSGRARPIEVDAVRWVRPQQLRDFAFPRANQIVIEQLLDDA